MAGMLNSVVVVNPDNDIFDRITAYCEENGLKITIFKNLPQSNITNNTVVVWGTKTQLNDFGKYF